MAKPASTTLQWCLQEAGPVMRGARLVVGSQFGYEGRQMQENMRKKCLRAAVLSTGEIDPLNKPSESAMYLNALPQISLPPLPGITSPSDALRRAEAVGAGIKVFSQLLAQGKFPGSGGYTVSEDGKRAYGGATSLVPSDAAKLVINGLEKMAALFQSGTIAFPNWAPPQLFDKMAALGVQTISASHAGTTPPVQGESPESTQPDTGLTPKEIEFLVKAAQSVDDFEAEEKLLGKSNKNVYRPELPKEYDIDVAGISATMISDSSRERSVPAGRIARLATFGQLGVGLAAGAAAELTRRAFRFGPTDSSNTADRVFGNDNPFLTQANADRIVQTLCRVRGAALKLGQMLSIQDAETVPPALLEIFERVRHSADFMPTKQVFRQMSSSFGPDWRDLFESFDERPFAAASIGQVHRATLKDDRVVAVKVQYPGVAKGIDSDIDNLVSILSVGGLFPKGMFLDEFVTVARRELKQECDYEREARAMRKFHELTECSKDFYVPQVIDELSSSQVLTSEFVVGRPVDACVGESQVVRDYIAGKFIELCLKEIFEWRFMQTDPNWSNFFLGKHPRTGEMRLVLLDFGASRSYSKSFVDKYMNIIRGAYDGDHEKIIKYSRDIGFLTGYETRVMEKAHCESILILGETLTSDHPYDFSHQNVTRRIHQLIPVMLEHRLTSPPEEIYSLHRKLSGSYLLATKLKATVSCGAIFQEIYDKYCFGDDGRCIDIETVKENVTV